MKKEEWAGIDVNLEISLFEYGLLVCKNWQCTAPDEWFCLVGTKTDDGECFTHFDHGYIREREVETEDWINWESFYDFCETSEMEWREQSFVNKFHDLLQYYNHQNFGFGTNYEFEIKKEALDSYILNMQGK